MDLPHPVDLPRARDLESTAARAQALDQLSDGDLRRALHELPENYRVVVYLAEVEGFSHREIAQIIGTVTSRLHRGRLELRRLLKDCAAAINRASRQGDDGVLRPG